MHSALKEPTRVFIVPHSSILKPAFRLKLDLYFHKYAYNSYHTHSHVQNNARLSTTSGILLSANMKKKKKNPLTKLFSSLR